MQPDVNMGIRGRTHFEPLGFSKKRSLKPINRQITSLEGDINKGVFTFASSLESAQEHLKELKEVRKALLKVRR